MKMPPITKLLFCDLDGTLLDPACRLSKENYDAITTLRERGVLLVPTSGRCYAEIPAELREHPAVEMMITSNGAHAVHAKTKETAAHFPMPPAEHLFLYGLMKEKVYAELFHEGGQVWSEKEKFMNHADYGINQYTFDALLSRVAFLDEYDAHRRAIGDMDMSVAFFRDPRDLADYVKALEEDGRFSVVFSTSGGAEVMHAGVSKGTTVPLIAERYGIPLSDCMAAGDSHNDLTMFGAVGLSMATANGGEEVKAAADTVICKNSEHILPYILANVPG